MRHSVAAYLVAGVLLACVAACGSAYATITIKDRAISEPLVLDQNDDYYLHKVYISGVTDLAALTLTGKINSVIVDHCLFSNIWAGMNGKALAAEAQGAIVNSFVAMDTGFEDAQHQLLCFREGAFGTVTFQRCKFRTSDAFLKKIYANDPWRVSPPTTEFANIERLELLDNEYTNTILVIHPSVKTVVFRGDMTNVRLGSPSTHVIRLERGQEPGLLQPGTLQPGMNGGEAAGTAVAVGGASGVQAAGVAMVGVQATGVPTVAAPAAVGEVEKDSGETTSAEPGATTEAAAVAREAGDPEGVGHDKQAGGSAQTSWAGILSRCGELLGNR